MIWILTLRHELVSAVVGVHVQVIHRGVSAQAVETDEETVRVCQEGHVDGESNGIHVQDLLIAHVHIRKQKDVAELDRTIVNDDKVIIGILRVVARVAQRDVLLDGLRARYAAQEALLVRQFE